MDVTVVIVNFNTADLTCRAIQSVRDHTGGISYEIVVVDNHSTDNSIGIIRNIFPDISVIANGENAGFARACNQGIRESSGKYILLLNSDAEFLNNTAEILATALDSDPRLGAVSARLENEDGTPQSVCQRFPRAGIRLTELLRLQKFLRRGMAGRVMLGSWFGHDEVCYPDWAWGTCLMVRRKAVECLPGSRLDEELFLYGEDRQWCWQLRRSGWTIGFIPEARVLHLLNGSGGSSEERIKAGYRDFLQRNLSTVERGFVKLVDGLL